VGDVWDIADRLGIVRFLQHLLKTFFMTWARGNKTESFTCDRRTEARVCDEGITQEDSFNRKLPDLSLSNRTQNIT
jgi:hypothetical protein